MPDFFGVDLYYGLAAGGAVIWLFRPWVQKKKGKFEVKIGDLSDAAKRKLGL